MNTKSTDSYINLLNRFNLFKLGYLSEVGIDNLVHSIMNYIKESNVHNNISSDNLPSKFHNWGVKKNIEEYTITYDKLSDSYSITILNKDWNKNYYVNTIRTFEDFLIKYEFAQNIKAKASLNKD